eukprot:Nk52_evm37s355 gene=Nk52_evmTU37s355
MSTMSAIRGLWGTYTNLLKVHPLKTKCATTGVIMTIGDIGAQVLLEKRAFEDVDLKRTSRNSITGVMVVGPFAHHWFKMLEGRFGASQSVGTVAKKILADQVFATPFIVNAVLFTTTALSGKGLEGAVEKVKTTGPEAVLSAYKVWPIANGLNFMLVPIHFRVLYTNCVSMGWSTYLAYLNYKNV